MARVFITFVGAGSYTRTIYESPDGRRSSPTTFSQCALVELYRAATFDRFEVFVTKTSKERNWEALRGELARLGVTARLEPRQIPETLDEASQWSWFEELLLAIDPHDTLVFDVTHGYRAIPLVMCAAIGYLRRAKRVRIEGIFYGAENEEDKQNKVVPQRGLLVDMSGFFVIHDWAEGVARLVESADARKLAELAADATVGSFAGLRDPALIGSLQRLTDALKNVEVHSVELVARDALHRLAAQRDAARTHAEAQLVQLVIDKMTTLAVEEPTEGRYTRDYLTLQVRVASLLIEHGLLMQAFTVLRELVGSIGMFGVPEKHRSKAAASASGRALRGRFAETFIAMLQFPRQAWAFVGQREIDEKALVAWYEQVLETGVQVLGSADALPSLLREIADLRNGFDHAWTSKAGPPADVALRARDLCARLGKVVAVLPDP